MIMQAMRWVTMGTTGEMWAAQCVLDCCSMILPDLYPRGPAPIILMDNSVGKHDSCLFLAAGARSRSTGPPPMHGYDTARSGRSWLGPISRSGSQR